MPAPGLGTMLLSTIWHSNYASDSCGYAFGGTVGYLQDNGALRFGTFSLPTTAAGPSMAYDSIHHGEVIELEFQHQILQAQKPPMTMRFLVFRNSAPMGNFRDALAASSTPDVTTVRRPTSKAGLCFNAEQAIADGGATGIFFRAGMNDGKSESYGFADADRTISFGGQISGSRWNRKEDAAAIAIGFSGLSSSHQAYLAAGGLGLNLGEGRRSYGPDSVLEADYSRAITPRLTGSLDFQRVRNPGYNRDRGPTLVIAARLHYSF